ncbi:hypothetical protein [Streptomyces sp. NPDC058613]|uniref:hypothetical protein n=1 Tax=unclassified Streptomyces TaxID=2593676 RepID=UPI003649B97B
MSARPHEYPRGGDPTAVPAALGLGFLAVGGWLLATARPWQKPGSALSLGLGWSASAVFLLCGLVLLTRCVRAVHRAGDAAGGPQESPHGGPYGPRYGETGRTGETPPRPTP